MKIDLETVRRLLDEAKDEGLKPVNDAHLMADYGDKMYNFGVEHMYHAMIMKLFRAEDIARGVG